KQSILTQNFPLGLRLVVRNGEFVPCDNGCIHPFLGGLNLRVGNRLASRKSLPNRLGSCVGSSLLRTVNLSTANTSLDELKGLRIDVATLLGNPAVQLAHGCRIVPLSLPYLPPNISTCCLNIQCRGNLFLLDLMIQRLIRQPRLHLLLPQR